MVTGGQKLRVLREKLGLTMRDIETASERIARKRDVECDAGAERDPPELGHG